MSSLVKSSLNGSSLISDLERMMIGSDSLFDRLYSSMSNSTGYPPMNIVQLDDNNTLVEFALAGFIKDELSVYTQHGKLYVEGNKITTEDEKNRTYHHRGLAKRSFVQTLLMSDDQLVDKVEFENGLLQIYIKRVIPEHQQRKNYL